MDIKNFQKVPVWYPKEDSGRRIKKLMKIIEGKYDVKFDDYFDFHKWSVENISQLWAEIWDFSGIIYSKNYSKVMDLSLPLEDTSKWFEGARLNFAENILKYKDDGVAIIVCGEDRNNERTTYRQLYAEAKLYAAAFRKVGLSKGDRVACYMSNRKEAILGMLAVTSIGAIWTGALPLLGPQAYLNRLKQVEPKFLLTVDQFPHNGETKERLDNIREIAKGLTSLEMVVIVPSKPESKLKSIADIPNCCFLDKFLEHGFNADGSVPEMKFEQLPFSHPVFISYTSGTTGLPKTIVHGFGSLFTGLRDFWIHWDSRREDVWLSLSPVGWVSWNMVNNFLFVGETIVLFEGVPYFLTPTFLWDLVDELKITRAFITPSVMEELESRGYTPTEKHHLSSLSMILTGGSVVKPRSFEFALNKVKKGITFCIGYGCTEIMGFCVVSELTLPMHSGEISAPSIGVAVECLDDSGQNVQGEMGEFVITKPMPTFPVGLWGDIDGQLLKKSYFSKYPGKFCIGDMVVINPVTHGITICGRSDETLKQRGCRFGSSEIYNIVNTFREIKDSLCVAQYSKEMDERAVLFIQMNEGHSFSHNCEERLRKKIADELSARHVPEVMLEIEDIPFNINSKKMEIIVKKIINKKPFNAEMIVNPESLKCYQNIPELENF